jgi:Ankyrin repeats (many copies)
VPLRIASSPSDSFTYPADLQEESHSKDAHGEEEEEFLYPGIGDVDAVLGALPVPSSDTITSTPSPSGSQVAVPLDSSELTEYPSSNEALHETSPHRPDPNPNPSLPAQPHASPAQLEALYAASSSGDLTLLQRIINNALQTGNVESFSLVNGASSRTGLTALHAAASRGYIDIVKWCKASLFPGSHAF